jgi:hypothetical protein
MTRTDGRQHADTSNPVDTYDDDCDATPHTADVADVVLGGSRFIAWTIGPVATIAAAGLLLTAQWSLSLSCIVRSAVVATLLLFAAALWWPRRCAVAARIGAGIVFLLCAAYVADTVHSGDWRTDKRGDTSVANAIQVLLMFGIPCLWIALRGRRRRPTTQSLRDSVSRRG